MRQKVTLLTLCVVLCAVSRPVNAQQVDLTDDRTPEQMWSRTVYLLDFAWITMISYAKSNGQTADDVGRYLGEIAAPSWGEPGSRTIASFVRGMYRNLKLYSDLEFEILSEAESEIHGRMNIPYASRFGESGENDGVTLQEYVRVWCLASEGIADYLGFDMTHDVGSDQITFAVKTRP